VSGRQKISRGTAPRRKVQPKARKIVSTRPGPLSRLAAALSIRPETVQRATTWSVTGLGTAAVLGVAYMTGLPQMVGVEIGEATGRAGFEVKRVEVTGIDRMERLTVYAIALDQPSMAMPLVDLDRIRGDLKRYGWVSEARVSRRLPDTLVIDIVERTPAAIWQNNQSLSLVDGEGVVLEPVALDAMPDLPLVIGPDANKQTGALEKLIARAPSLEPMLAGAAWVGGRRWDLRFQSGETLALPEGEGPAAAALVKFARMDGVERLLGRGFVRFDMRDPTRLVVRVGKQRPAIDDIDAGQEPQPALPGGRVMRVNDTI
jgi:cell division protein FtsQ